MAEGAKRGSKPMSRTEIERIRDKVLKSIDITDHPPCMTDEQYLYWMAGTSWQASPPVCQDCVDGTWRRDKVARGLCQPVVARQPLDVTYDYKLEKADPSTIAALDEIRVQEGVKAFARVVGVTFGTIYNVLKGKAVGEKKLQRIKECIRERRSYEAVD